MSEETEAAEGTEPTQPETEQPEAEAPEGAADELIDGYEAVTFVAVKSGQVVVDGRPYVVHVGENTLPSIVADIAVEQGWA